MTGEGKDQLIIVKAGAACKTVFVVDSGTVEAMSMTEDADKQNPVLLGQGDTFGMSDALKTGKHEMQVTTAAPSRAKGGNLSVRLLELPVEDIYTLPASAFQQAMIAEISTLRAPTIAQNLTKRIADDSVHMSNDLRVSASELVTIEQKTATDLSEIRSLLDDLVRQDKTGEPGGDGAPAVSK